jgi:hypothetical protein
MILWDVELGREIFDYGISIGDTAYKVRQLRPALVLVGVDADGEREQGRRCTRPTEIESSRLQQRMRNTFQFFVEIGQKYWFPCREWPQASQAYSENERPHDINWNILLHRIPNVPNRFPDAIHDKALHRNHGIEQ